MSPTQLTAQQRNAIFERQVSVALSAGAGCGKTSVLTERFLSHLEPSDDPANSPTDLGELVAITFTERAAREMRDRIRGKCYERLQEANGNDATYWLQLLRSLDRARVSTIHSFCAALLRSHAVEAELDPRFVVLDQSQADTLQGELIDDCLRRQLAAHDELALSLVAQFGLERLRDAVRTLLAARAGLADERWRSATPAEQVRVWEKFHREQALVVLLGQLADGDEARDMLRILREIDPTHPVMQERRTLLIELLPALAGSRQPAADLARLREAAMVRGAGGKKFWPDEDLYERYKKAAENLRQAIDEMKGLVEFDAQAALPAAEAGCRLLELARAIAGQYEARKQELGLLDFDDLVFRACQLLADPAHAGLKKQIAANVRWLLVDEFQDTDPAQVALVRALCDREGGHRELGAGEMRDDGLCNVDVGGGKLFFVGDSKQSIYRFRGAKPHVFRELRQATPAAGRLPLTLNFRSQPAILEFVNALFCTPFGETYEPLQASREQVSPRPAVEFLWAVEETLERGSADRSRRLEADWIARRIRAMLDSQQPIVWDAEAAQIGKPAARPPQPGDFAILLRALTDVGHYEAALQRYEIDYYLVGGHAFYAQQEVYDLTNLLRALDHPGDEVSLAGVLRSPFFSLADETLFWLARHPEGLAGGLYASKLPAEIGEDQRGRVAFAAETLRVLRARKDRVPVADLVSEALARTGYDAVLLAEFLGERKLANLRKLTDQARDVDRSGLFGLSDFIFQLSQFVARQPREPLAATHPESTDVVRLMSIHQSKGLEFPIVFVPDLERYGHGRGSGVEFSAELGPLVKPPDVEIPCCGYGLQQVINRQEEQEEQVRLLYVACTRAADYLVLTSGIGDLEKPVGAWTKLVAERFDLESGVLRGSLPSGHPAPQIRVTREAPETERRPIGRTLGKPWPELIERARQLAAGGQGAAIATAPISPDRGARRQFSFSQLTGALQAVDGAGEPTPQVSTLELNRQIEIRPQKLGQASRRVGIQRTLQFDQKPESARDPIDPLSLGLLAHTLLAQIGTLSLQDLPALARRLAPRFVRPQMVSSSQPGADAEAEVAIDLVSRFLGCQRAKDLAASIESYAELEFMLAWPPKMEPPVLPLETVPSEPGAASGVYLQGVIDCLYCDPAGMWHILDYKTNRVTHEDLAETAANYEMQIGVYALAVEQVLQQSPCELVLHFLRPSLEWTFAWDQSARERVVGKVNQAIVAATGKAQVNRAAHALRPALRGRQSQTTKAH